MPVIFLNKGVGYKKHKNFDKLLNEHVESFSISEWLLPLIFTELQRSCATSFKIINHVS